MKKVVVLFALVFLPLSTAYADSGWFLGFGGGLVTFDDTGVEYEPTNVFARGGFALNEHIELGAELSVTLFPDTIGPYDFDVDTTFLFVKGNIPINENTKLYAMIGRSTVELTVNYNNVSASLDDDGIGYGVGIQVDLNEANSFTIDYISYFDDNEFDGYFGDVATNSLNFGYTTHF